MRVKRSKGDPRLGIHKPRISPLRYALSKIILQTWVPLSGALFAPDVGKPQISPLRCAPVEMTKLGVVANQAFLNPIFIPLGGPQAHVHSGRDDKVMVVARN